MAAPNILSTIAKVVQAIGIVMDIVKPHETIENIGEKVIQAGEQGITLESFDDDFQKYKERIDRFKIDPEKAKDRPVEHQQIAGIAYVERGLLNRSSYLGISNLYPLMAAQKNFFSPERMQAYAQVAQDVQFSMNKIKNYFDGSCAFSERSKIEDFLHSAEKRYDSGYNKENYADTLNRVCSNVKAVL
ncbi:MAG: hypothetical protein CSB33_01120 [Desulfobacterales bacterium]|nr:MAG: hypothetical protein CSB33_01120 [Desulfobacterales bacterium]